jgi:hypothetical protein
LGTILGLIGELSRHSDLGNNIACVNAVLFRVCQAFLINASV